jgi:hypothetical protein
LFGFLLGFPSFLHGLFTRDVNVDDPIWHTHVIPHIPPKDFRRVFWMYKELFMMILDGVREFDYYFLMNKYCTKLHGFSSV